MGFYPAVSPLPPPAKREQAVVCFLLHFPLGRPSHLLDEIPVFCSSDFPLCTKLVTKRAFAMLGGILASFGVDLVFGFGNFCVNFGGEFVEFL